MLLRQMEYLQAVVESGNFYLAAERCNVSQSAISQQIKKLETELGVSLLERHNRTFSLTPAGEYFYNKSLAITGDLSHMVKETQRISRNDHATLRIGYYKGYHGNELSQAIALFSEKYPAIDVQIIAGSHETLFNGMENDSIDLALNDQRRAFSDAYNNEILAKCQISIEVSANNPLSKARSLTASDLKKYPCILVMDKSGQREEQEYYEKIIGLKSQFLFAETLQEARLKIITDRGYLPVDVVGNEIFSDTSFKRIPLLRNAEPVNKLYCAFWKKNNSGYYIESFAEILKNQFIRLCSI